MSSSDQLLVLGNGFDLQCGLKSRFSDFEAPRKQEINDWVDKLSDMGNFPEIHVSEPSGREFSGKSITRSLWDNGLTVWDFILIDDEKTRNWYDIEECIKDWLQEDTSNHTNGHLSHMERIADAYFDAEQLQDFDHSGSDTGPSLLDQLTNDAYFDYLDYDMKVAKFLYELYGYSRESEQSIGYKSLLKIMLEELHRYETAFADYLLNHVENNPGYWESSVRLIARLLNHRLTASGNEMPEDFTVKWPTSIVGDLDSVRILDFNYTNPFMWTKTPGSRQVLTNIHGYAGDENVIFGIDGNDVDIDDPYYQQTVKFTKTYRLMALRKDGYEPFVHSQINGQPGTETRVIKFFGHSLGTADYSYFQAIFDEVGLYESRTHLIFYYNEKRSEDKTRNAEEEMYEKVNRLITTYGQTLDNKDHGHNLLHKLLLEGRLNVVQAPV